MRNLAERYQQADTGLVDSHHSKTDPLIAAGLAAIGSPEVALKLRLINARDSGRTPGWRELVVQVAEWVPRKGFHREIQLDIAANVLLWWLTDKVCHTCFGVKHPLIPNSNRTDESRACLPCKGTGRTFVERCVDVEYADLARDLASRLEALEGVFGAMQPRLRGD
jgi:hypothetical protein